MSRDNHSRTLSVVAAVPGTLLAAPAIHAQSVRVNWRSKADFSTYKTFARKISPKERKSFNLPWVRSDVDKALEARGMKRVSLNQHSDMIVVYHFITQEVMDATTTTDGFGWGDGG